MLAAILQITTKPQIQIIQVLSSRQIVPTAIRRIHGLQLHLTTIHGSRFTPENIKINGAIAAIVIQIHQIILYLPAQLPVIPNQAQMEIMEV